MKAAYFFASDGNTFYPGHIEFLNAVIARRADLHTKAYTGSVLIKFLGAGIKTSKDGLSIQLRKDKMADAAKVVFFPRKAGWNAVSVRALTWQPARMPPPRQNSR